MFPLKGVVNMLARKITAALLAVGLFFGADAITSLPSTEASIRFILPSRHQDNTFSQEAQEMLRLVNLERAKVGAKPLRLSHELMEACHIRAYEITQSFSHTRPNGKKFSSLIRDGKYTAGENIAAGYSTVAETVEQWMNSPGHRANILRADYTELGVGHCYRDGSEHGHYWVQIFKRPYPV